MLSSGDLTKPSGTGVRRSEGVTGPGSLRKRGWGTHGRRGRRLRNYEIRTMSPRSPRPSLVPD